MTTKIPQNVDKEDKLVGPLTLKQFLYMLGGAAFTFVTYQYAVQGYLYFTEFVLIGILIMGFASMLAFVQINGRPFTTFLANLGQFIISPKRKLWQKEDAMAEAPVKLTNTSPTARPATKSVNKSQLEKLANILDTGGKMNGEAEPTEHEIQILAKPTTPPRPNERDLGVEDVLSDTES